MSTTRRPTFGQQLTALAIELECQGLAERVPVRRRRRVSAFDVAALHRTTAEPVAVMVPGAPSGCCRQCDGPLPVDRPAYCSMDCAAAARRSHR